MDQSTFTNQWEGSRSLNHQIMLTAASLEDDGFKIPHFSHSQSSSNINATFNSFDSSPLEYGSGNVPKAISWSTEQDLVPKEKKRESLMSHEVLLNWNHQTIDDHVSKKARQPSADEHIMAERKRRERLGQRFIALASIIPGLKKADKASILGDAIKYVKELEQTLKSLEDRKAETTAEPVADDRIDGSTGSSSDGKVILPEIQVRLSGRSVLVRVHCENVRGVLVKVLSAIEKLHLTVTDASAVPFLRQFLDITVTAQMEEGFSMTGKELAKEMSSSFHHLKG